MQIECVAPAAHRGGVVRANRYRAFTLAAALAGSIFGLLATEARSQVQIDSPNPGDISGVGTINAGTGSFGSISTGGLGVSGNTTLGNSPADVLTVGANSTFNAPVTVNGTLDASLITTDTMVANVGDVGFLSTTTIVNSGSITGGTLTTLGTATLGGNTTIGGTLATTGKATLDSLEVTNNATVEGNLTVKQFLQADTLDAFQGEFKVLRANTVTTGNMQNLGNFSNLGRATLGSLEVTNNADVKGNLTVQGNLDMIGGDITNVGTITASTGNIATVNSTTIVNSGNIKTKTLTVDEDAAVGGKLTVAKGATVSESLTVTPASTISMGGNRVQDVADPIALTDAANKGYVDAGLARAFRDIDRNTEGVALAMAMAGTPTLLPMENFALTANWGQFEGAHGLAAGLAVRLDKNIQLNGGIAYGPGESTVGTRAGIRIGW